MSRKFIYILGFPIFIVSFLFIAKKILIEWHDISNFRFNRMEMLITFVILIIYTANNYFLSTNWQKLLTWFGAENINKKFCHYIYAINLVNKYVPGSLFQYAGLQVMGKNIGLKQMIMGLASFFEILGVIISSSLIGVIGLILFNLNYKTVVVIGFISLIMAIIIFVSVFLKLLPKIKYLKKLHFPQFQYTAKTIFLNYIPILIRYIVFFIITGILLITISQTLTGNISVDKFPTIISVWSISWLLGFLVIGAPAGLGVREAVMITGMTPIVGSSKALIIAILFRIILIFGDLLFAVSGITWKHFAKKSSIHS